MAPSNAICFENNGTLQKWHVAKATPDIDKSETPTKSDALQKWHNLQKNVQRLPYLPSTELSDFEKEILKFVIYI